MASSEWMRGKCWDMAVALHHLTGFEIFGLYSKDVCHHAFVRTPDGQGIDARGLLSLERLKAGCAGQDIRPLSISDIETRWLRRPLSSSEIRAADRVIRQDARLRAAIALYRT